MREHPRGAAPIVAFVRRGAHRAGQWQSAKVMSATSARPGVAAVEPELAAHVDDVVGPRALALDEQLEGSRTCCRPARG
jgi:hypothetical protein